MQTKESFEAIVANCKFNDWQFKIGVDGERLFMQIICAGKCNVTGADLGWSGRKWFLSPHMTKSEVVTTAFKAVITAMEHETREQFTYQGVSIFDPHYDVDKLVELRVSSDCLDVRK